MELFYRAGYVIVAIAFALGVLSLLLGLFSGDTRNVVAGVFLMAIMVLLFFGIRHSLSRQ